MLHKWATATGRTADAIRDQLEAAAELVPEHQRARILGQLRSDQDDQAWGAAAVILLGLTLSNLGWSVQHEPVIDGNTPDLAIKKDNAEFVVEVRQVIGWTRDPDQRTYHFVKKALDGVTTTRPLHFTAAHVSPNVSLKRFRRHVEEIVSNPAVKGRQVFSDDGVLIAFIVGDDIGSKIPAFTGYVGQPMAGDDHDSVRAAIDEKLKKYKYPLIIALDMVDCIYPFMTVEEVLYGRNVIKIPINMATGGPAGEPTWGRAADGIVVRRDRDAARARERLHAVLPLTCPLGDEGFRVSARLFANPYSSEVAGLRGFKPIPRFLVGSSDSTSVTMQLFGGQDDAPIANPHGYLWTHLPRRG